MTETWKEVPGFEGHYRVSDMGNVMSLKGGKQRNLSLAMDASKGYLVACLRKDEKQRTYCAHRLVASAFIRPINPGEHVCHNDGNPMNNTLGNLRIDTPASNMKDRDAHGTKALGETHGRSKLTAIAVREIRRLRSTGIKIKEIAAQIGSTRGAVQDVIYGRTWSHT